MTSATEPAGRENGTPWWCHVVKCTPPPHLSIWKNCPHVNRENTQFWSKAGRLICVPTEWNMLCHMAAGKLSAFKMGNYIKQLQSCPADPDGQRFPRWKPHQSLQLWIKHCSTWRYFFSPWRQCAVTTVWCWWVSCSPLLSYHMVEPSCLDHPQHCSWLQSQQSSERKQADNKQKYSDKVLVRQVCARKLSSDFSATLKNGTVPNANSSVFVTPQEWKRKHWKSSTVEL